MKLKEIFKNRKIITILVIVIVLSLTGVWYYHSVTTSYELKLIKNEEYILWIGFQQYTFKFGEGKFYDPSLPDVGWYTIDNCLTVSCGNSTETKFLGWTLEYAVGSKILDLEILEAESTSIKTATGYVEGLRIVVRKW